MILLLRKIVTLTIALTLFTGVGVATFGAYHADAGGKSDVLSFVGKIFKPGWFGKAKQAGQKVGEGAKKVYNAAKWGAVGLAAADIAFNDANFLGSSLGFVFERMSAWFELIIPPPQELIYNFKTTVDSEGNETTVFKDKDQYYYYIFSDTVWESMKNVYYSMMAVFWSAVVIICAYQANHLLFPRGVQDKITATNIISTCAVTALAVWIMPFLVGIYTDLSMLFTALFANMADPELIKQGLINFEIEDKFTEAILKLIALAQMGMIAFIYFMRSVAILGLFCLFPILAALHNFPSKRHLLGMWNREMLANICIQPVHAFLYSFAFLLMQDGTDMEKIIYSSILLLAVIPAGSFVRDVFGTYGLAQSGAGWLKSAALQGLNGLGIASMIATGKLAKGAFQGAREAYEASPFTSAGGGFGQTVRNGLRFSAGAMGAIGGLAIGGARGAGIGAGLGAVAGSTVVNKVGEKLQSPSFKKAIHSAAARLPFLDQNYHSDKAQAYKDLLEMPEKMQQLQMQKDMTAGELQNIDSRMNPVFAAKREHLAAQQHLKAASAAISPADRVRGQGLLQQHGEAYHRVRPQLLHAHQEYNQAKANYEQAQANYQAIPSNSPDKPVAREQFSQAYQRLQEAKSNLNGVYQDKGLQALTRDGYRFSNPTAQYMDAAYKSQRSNERLQAAQEQFGTYEELEQSYTRAVDQFHRVNVSQAELGQHQLHVEQLTGKRVVQQRSVHPSMPQLKSYRLEPAFMPATGTEGLGVQNITRSNSTAGGPSNVRQRMNINTIATGTPSPTKIIQDVVQNVEPAWFSEPVTEKQFYTLEKMGVPQNIVKNKGEAHLYISGQKTFTKGLDSRNNSPQEQSTTNFQSKFRK